MIYSNDHTDKQLRKRNYLLTVFVLPIIAGLIVAAVTYLAYTKKYISEVDRNYCYFTAFAITTFLFTMNKHKWLPLPNGSHFRVQTEDKQQPLSFGEPIEYDKVYYLSKTKMSISLLMGIATIGFGVYIFRATTSHVISILTIGTGLFTLYQGIKGLLNKAPKLKISSKGLWTNNLGFVNWNDIAKAKVVTESSGEHSSSILEIYLKHTVFAEANYPDEKLVLDNLGNERFIKRNIEKFTQTNVQ